MSWARFAHLWFAHYLYPSAGGERLPGLNQREKGAVLDCVDHVRRAPEAILRARNEGLDLARGADVPGILLRLTA